MTTCERLDSGSMNDSRAGMPTGSPNSSRNLALTATQTCSGPRNSAIAIVAPLLTSSRARKVSVQIDGLVVKTVNRNTTEWGTFPQEMTARHNFESIGEILTRLRE